MDFFDRPVPIFILVFFRISATAGEFMKKKTGMGNPHSPPSLAPKRMHRSDETIIGHFGDHDASQYKTFF